MQCAYCFYIFVQLYNLPAYSCNQVHVLDYVKISSSFSQTFLNGTTHLSKTNGSLANGHVKHANGHANGKANGVANGYINGHVNGHANGSIHHRTSSSKETNGHIPQTEDTSFSVRARRLVCMSVDTSLQ